MTGVDLAALRDRVSTAAPADPPLPGDEVVVLSRSEAWTDDPDWVVLCDRATLLALVEAVEAAQALTSVWPYAGNDRRPRQTVAEMNLLAALAPFRQEPDERP